MSKKLIVGAFLFHSLASTWQAPADETKPDKLTESSAAMVLEINVARPDGGRGGYRRPYVAVWLIDKDGFPVRTIALWVQKTPPGPRWIPDLRQWSRDDRLRQLVDDKNLVDAISGPTRTSGRYKVLWDGSDDQGDPLPPGSYTLQIEAAREHGTYQIIREKLELDRNPITKTLKGNTEIDSVELKFRGLMTRTGDASR